MKRFYRPLFFYLTLPIFLLIGFGNPARGEVSDIDRFQLWNYCKPINIIVETLNSEARLIGLRKSSVEVAVRSRLRAARLYDEEEVTYLYVNINVLKEGPFSANINLNKRVLDYASDLSTTAKTWGEGRTGAHGQEASYVMSSLSQLTDQFIDEYLRVNESACR